MPLQQLNSELLQRTAQGSVAPITLPDPVAQQTRAMQLQNLAQQNQLGGMQLQEAQQKIQTQQRLEQQGAAAAQILNDNGGDIEKSLPQLAIHAPDLLPHFQSAAETNQKMATSKLAGQRDLLAAVQGSSAPEVTAGTPGSTFTPGAMVPEDGKVAPVPSPIPASFTKVMRLPTVNVGGVEVQPQSRQQIEDAATAKFKRDKQIEAELKSIDPLSPAGIAAKVDEARRVNQVNPKAQPTVRTAKGVMQFNPATMKWDIKVGDLPPTASAGGGTTSNTTETAKGIMEGLIPPNLSQVVSYKDRTAVSAELTKNGYNLSLAASDWNAMQKHLATLNGAQQERLRQAITFSTDTLPQIEAAYAEWKKQAGISGFKLLNKANLASMKQLPGAAGSAATNLDALIADFTSELGTVYKGGNGSTDESLILAAKNLSGDWNEQTFADAVKRLKGSLLIRSNSINTSTPVGLSTPPVTAPGVTAPAPSGAKIIKYDALGHVIPSGN